MFFSKKKHETLSAEHIEEENKKADEQVEAARKELSLAQRMAGELNQIRSENNFMNDFRASLIRGGNS